MIKVIEHQFFKEQQKDKGDFEIVKRPIYSIKLLIARKIALDVAAPCCRIILAKD